MRRSAFSHCSFWDRWQRKNGGQNIMKYNVGDGLGPQEFCPNLASLQGLPRESNEPVSLSNKCVMLGTGPDYTVVDLMDSSKRPSCFSVGAGCEAHIWASLMILTPCSARNESSRQAQNVSTAGAGCPLLFPLLPLSTSPP